MSKSCKATNRVPFVNQLGKLEEPQAGLRTPAHSCKFVDALFCAGPRKCADEPLNRLCHM